ncbi:MAG: Co2+/Mg2+ efflux protein ApaG [Gammaproteobacteria bacterium]|nr:Co2+/Mg2+ efflux protein ApaG [Gammaproteobacteria bacterium]
MNEQPPNIIVDVQTSYLADQSVPDLNRYVFAYTVTIRNQGAVPAKLLSRHWIITDARGRTQEVRGMGVVGEQPHIKPGEGFQYTSGTVLETPVGSMEGTYQMITDGGDAFDATIPAFTLSTPRSLH